MAGKDRQHAQGLSQLWNFMGSHAMTHDQAAVGAAEFTQARIQIGQRLADEFDPTVGAWQFAQDGAVENKGHMHLTAVFQGVEKRGVVVHTQIAAQPDQTRGVSGVHGVLSEGQPLKSPHVQ